MVGRFLFEETNMSHTVWFEDSSLHCEAISEGTDGSTPDFSPVWTQWGIFPVFRSTTPDGAELLLDLGLPAAIIGGIVLPLLGAVPDSAMIVASGAVGTRDEANSKITVGMG